MFIKIKTSEDRQYVKLVGSFRDEQGVSRQRVVATLGRLESVRAGGNDALINGLLRAAGKPTLDDGTGEATFPASPVRRRTPAARDGVQQAERLGVEAGYCAMARRYDGAGCCA